MINRLVDKYSDLSRRLDHISGEALSLLARLVFIFTLLAFFWKSALTKIGQGIGGLFNPSAGAYAQILPLKFESVGYDTSAMGVLDWLVVMAGTYGEFILPLLIVIGFATRFAAIGMIGFIVVMSIVDVTGHGVAAGSLFDGDPSSIIPDQRLLWIFPLLILFFKGPGTFSVDRVVCLSRKTNNL